ncbi:glycerophosphodiester phosphodiesterase [Virgibacillus oceani]|uniref:Glycerophosphoryl diester phosphodiesterase n=1 Tax=Virgibacillus oceani TaxID=1479511 RepID=A0A917M3P6_9BACI|nr:glycerophosphodiester phosphodiesterase family protein [Virgibacillus oceani]GGG73354.1 glycerophosphoryl diester phosphodiesterase [Virgibacillus oceani]
MVLNFAHRGSLTEAPENTLPAFQKAISHGAHALELDVQLTKDDQLIVCHDHKLSRFNKLIKGLIKDFMLEEIKQIDVGASFSEAYKGTTLITLDELLEICPEDIMLNIEIKNIPVIYEGIEAKLIDCLKRRNRMENIIISSFDHIALANIQKLAPELDLGMLFYYRILRPWEYAKHSGLTITSIHPNNVYVDQTFVQECKRLGYKVYPYTVNKEERYKELIHYGADGVFSNNPEIFVR